MEGRKRSGAVQLALLGVGAAALLAIDQWRSGGDDTVTADLFTTAGQCKASGKYTPAQCDDGYAAAASRDVQQAPRYARPEDCEAEFSQSGCHALPPTTAAASGSYFAPAMAAFLIAGAGTAAGLSLPAYRSCSPDAPIDDPRRCSSGRGGGGGAAGGGGGRWFTGSGYYLRSSGSGSAVQVSQSAFSARPMATTLSRGGFGVRAAAVSARG